MVKILLRDKIWKQINEDKYNLGTFHDIKWKEVTYFMEVYLEEKIKEMRK